MHDQSGSQLCCMSSGHFAAPSGLALHPKSLGPSLISPALLPPQISVLEAADTSPSTDRLGGSSRRALGPPKGVSQQHAAAAAEYLLDFVFSAPGAQTRSWLTLDLLLSYKQGLSLLTRMGQVRYCCALCCAVLPLTAL